MIIPVLTDNMNKFIKYLLFGLVWFLALNYIPEAIIQPKEIAIMCVIGVISFAILDNICPSVTISKNNPYKL
jgi:hypothetical protein